jgi:hypothetical protein
MLVDRAASSRYERYDRWYALLQEEIELVASSNPGIIAVGKVVARYLEERCFPRSFSPVIHYSGRAARARNQGIIGREDEFHAFSESVALEDVVATAEEVLRVSRAPSDIYDETLSRLARSKLTSSRKKLIFNYKIAFDSMQREVIAVNSGASKMVKPSNV